MSDSLPDDAWVNSFLPTPPRPLLNSLQRRLQASTTHINALAELYKQRAAIEAQYADSLSKLARTAESGGLNGKNGVEWDKASGEGKIWDSVVSEIVEVSKPGCKFSIANPSRHLALTRPSQRSSGQTSNSLSENYRIKS